jgi:hypothetical protein
LKRREEEEERREQELMVSGRGMKTPGPAYATVKVLREMKEIGRIR